VPFGRGWRIIHNVDELAELIFNNLTGE
jgi:hypothetical protein